MALLCYLKTNVSTDTMLPDPRGPLAKQIPLRLCNGEVRQVLQAQQAVELTKRGSYDSVCAALQRAGHGNYNIILY